MNYVDGYVIAVPTASREAYRKMAEAMAVVFKKHGALSVVENWGDDVPEGKLTSFTMAVKREETESIVFSWITWPSRAVRDAAWKLCMEDPIMKDESLFKIFDGKRMIFGGFETIVQA
ncbi:MAG TPA: DUF1428 domain-containing protein [Burkholderiaceae bacterium]|nr:DUF1428 domain-containing protein [Burkholderiaceae bacterium]